MFFSNLLAYALRLLLYTIEEKFRLLYFKKRGAKGTNRQKRF